MSSDTRDAELIILLILGSSDGKVRMLHLQKMFFCLWRFSPQIRKLVDFEPHLKGPFSFDVNELARAPEFLPGHWEYIPPKNRSEAEDVKGGYLRLTRVGEEAYADIMRKLEKQAKTDNDVLALLGAVRLVVNLYSKLEWDELLFLVYTDQNIRGFSKRSALLHKILTRTGKIVDRLILKGIVPEEKRKAILQRAKRCDVEQ